MYDGYCWLIASVPIGNLLELRTSQTFRAQTQTKLKRNSDETQTISEGTLATLQGSLHMQILLRCMCVGSVPWFVFELLDAFVRSAAYIQCNQCCTSSCEIPHVDALTLPFPSCTCAAANPVARGTCTEARARVRTARFPRRPGPMDNQRNSDETQMKLRRNSNPKNVYSS